MKDTVTIAGTRDTSNAHAFPLPYYLTPLHTAGLIYRLGASPELATI